jgi:EAL domain-containing protein (putative c-di-GMP-specific phosphodiesterase class I)
MDLFVLHAQRIVDVVSGVTLRHELILWMVDRVRLILAGEFVLAAEEFGSIREIDQWMVGRAIEIAARGHAVDVNLSVRSVDEEMLTGSGSG